MSSLTTSPARVTKCPPCLNTPGAPGAIRPPAKRGVRRCALLNRVRSDRACFASEVTGEDEGNSREEAEPCSAWHDTVRKFPLINLPVAVTLKSLLLTLDAAVDSKSERTPQHDSNRDGIDRGTQAQAGRTRCREGGAGASASSNCYQNGALGTARARRHAREGPS